MATTHTPGPWNAHVVWAFERPVMVREHIAIRPECGPTFAFLPIGKSSRVDIQERNVAVITAAPEMLEMLKAFEAMLTPAVEWTEEQAALVENYRTDEATTTVEVQMAILNHARAVIAKAEGASLPALAQVKS